MIVFCFSSQPASQQAWPNCRWWKTGFFPTERAFHKKKKLRQRKKESKKKFGPRGGKNKENFEEEEANEKDRENKLETAVDKLPIIVIWERMERVARWNVSPSESLIINWWAILSYIKSDFEALILQNVQSGWSIELDVCVKTKIWRLRIRSLVLPRFQMRKKTGWSSEFCPTLFWIREQTEAHALSSV